MSSFTNIQKGKGESEQKVNVWVLHSEDPFGGHFYLIPNYEF